jgi:hypothetical protein
MSGTAAGNLRIQVGIDGVPAAEAALTKVEGAVGRVSKGTTSLGQESSKAGGFMERARGQATNFGQQLQDVAVQAQSGTNALTILGQQGSQFLSAFGPAGAIAGAAVAIGAAAAGFLLTAGNAEKAKVSANDAFAAMQKGASDTSTSLRTLNDLFLTAGQRAANLANAQRTALRDQFQGQLAALPGQQTPLYADLAKQQKYIADYNAILLSGKQYGAGGESDEDRNRLATAIVRVKELQSQIAATTRESDRLNQALRQVDNAGFLKGDEYGPEDPSIRRAELDKRFKIENDYRLQIAKIETAINDKILEGKAAEDARASATKDRDDALKALDGTAGKAAAARAAESKAAREAIQAERDAADDLSRRYAVLRMDSKGLLIGSRNDEIAAAEIRKVVLPKKAEAETAAKDAKRIQEKALQEQRQEAQRTIDSVVDYGSDRFADLFSETSGGWDRTMARIRQTAIGTFAKMVGDALLRPIIQPFYMQNAGTIGSLSGANGAAAGGGTPLAANGTAYLQSGGGIASIGKSFMGTGASNTGIGFVDNALNATAYSYGGLSAEAASQATAPLAANTYHLSSGAAAQFANAPVSGPVLTDAGAATAGATDISFGAAAGGVLSIAGGLYGIYQGIQTGGAKGTAQGVAGAAGVAGGAAALAGGAAAGGAIAAIGAVAPYIAAIALVASMFLPGQKPSDRTGVARYNLDTGVNDVIGLEGVRYSQGNRDLAQQLGQSVSDLAGSLRTAMGVDRSPFNFEVGAGDRDGLTAQYAGQTRRYEYDEAGSKQLVNDLTLGLIESMKGLASAEVQSVISHSGGDVERTLSNLDFYNNTYKVASNTTVEEPLKAAGSFITAFNQVGKTIEDITVKARELGLSTEGLSKNLASAQAALYQARAVELYDNNRNFEIRRLQAEGQERQAALIALDLQQEQERRRYSEWLQDRELVGTEGAEQMANLERTLAAERLAVQRDYADQAKALDAEVLLSARAAHNETVTAWGRLADLDVRQQTASSPEGRASLDTTLVAFDARAEAERGATFESLVREGLNGTELMAQTMLATERALAAERLKIQKDYAEQSKAIEIDALIASRADHNQTVTNWQRLTDLDVRQQTASSPDGRVSLDATLAAFDARAEAERSATFESLVREGLNGTEIMARTMVETEKALAAERLKVQKDYAAQSLASDRQTQATARGLLEDLAFGSNSALSSQQQYFASQQTYNAARRGLSGGATEDAVSEYARASRLALGEAADFFGRNSTQYAALASEIADAVRSVAPAADTAGLADLLSATNSGNEALIDIQMQNLGLQSQNLDVLKSMRDQLARQGGQIEALMRRLAA